MSEPEYYEVLGLSPEASLAEIKLRFRSLARRIHPDVSANVPDSHESFVRISEAYQVLSDPVQRAGYDLRRRDRERLRQHIASRQAQRAAESASRRPSGSTRSAPGANRPGQSYAEARAARERAYAEQLLHAGEAAYSLGRLRDAARSCRAVLELDRRSAGAYELMGDIFARQRRTDEAIQMYTMAAQLTPANGLLLGKLNRIQARDPRTRPKEGEPTRVARAARLSSQSMQRVFWMLLAAGVNVFLMMVFANSHGAGPSGLLRSFPFVNLWTDTLLCLMVVAGCFTGVALAVSGMTRAMDEELFYPRSGTLRTGIPLGMLVGVVSAIWFYLAAAMYIIVASIQEALSTSVLVVIGCSVLITSGFAGIAWFSANELEQCRQILLFGGNVVFLTMLAGWFIGDIFRPLWA